MSGVTDRLFAMAAAAVRGERAEVMQQLDELRSRHEAAATALLSESGRRPVIEALAAHINDLRAVLTAVAILQEASPRSLDGLAAAGELMSSRIVAAALAGGRNRERVDRSATRRDHQCFAHVGHAAAGRDSGRRGSADSPAPRGGPLGGDRRICRRHRERHHHDARSRRIGLLGGARRRGARLPGDSDLDRRRRHADGRSARGRRSARRAGVVVRRGIGARLLRREGAASEHDPAGGRAGHPGQDPQQPASGEPRHAASPPPHRRRARSRRLPASGALR